MKAKQVRVWPAVVAVKDGSFDGFCRLCNTKSVISETMARFLNVCPVCESKEFQMVRSVQDGFWAVRLTPSPKKNQPPVWHDMGGPYSDPNEAVVLFSAQLGYLLPRAEA